MTKTNSALKIVGPSTSLEDHKRYLAEIEAAFPTVDPGVEPLYGRVLVQLRTAQKSKIITRADGSKAELHYTDYSQEVEKDVQQVGRVISWGPLAFKVKQTMEPWPECVVNGEFVPPVKIGDYVRVPKFGGDRHYVPVPNGPKDHKAVFVAFNDLELISKITCNPLSIIMYLE